MPYKAARVALLVALCLTMGSSSADAGRRRCRRQRCCQTYSCCPAPSCCQPVAASFCSSNASASLKNIQVGSDKVTGEIWVKVFVKCGGTTLVNADAKVADFTIGKDGVKVHSSGDLGCAHLEADVYWNGSQACIDWKITGCKFHIPADGDFQLNESGSACF